jgi:hypothetical protein
MSIFGEGSLQPNKYKPGIGQSGKYWVFGHVVSTAIRDNGRTLRSKKRPMSLDGAAVAAMQKAALL